MLVIADDDYYKMTGCDPKDDQTASLTSVANTYGFWRWGDVYGYEVTKETHCENDTNEVLDSCGRFLWSRA